MSSRRREAVVAKEKMDPLSVKVFFFFLRGSEFVRKADLNEPWQNGLVSSPSNDDQFCFEIGIQRLEIKKKSPFPQSR